MDKLHISPKIKFTNFLKSNTPEQKRLRISSSRFIALWLFVIIMSTFGTAWSEYDETRSIAETTARDNFYKDQAFRVWAASHGGVYVPITEYTLPNPNLAGIPERDIETSDGTKLTLMTPNYILRQTMNSQSELYGIQSKITSLEYLHESNKPDEWEVQALESFEKGAAEVFEYTEIDGLPVLRLMRPMIMQEDCLKCHASQGYKVGDIRGGIGVLVPLKPIYEIALKHIYRITFGYVSIWLLGLVGIIFFFVRESARLEERNTAVQSLRESEERYRLLTDNGPDIIILLDRNGLTQFISPQVEAITGYSVDEFINKGMPAFIHPEDLPRVQHAQQQALAGQILESFKYRFIGKNGEIVYLSHSARPLYEEGKIVAIQNNVKDITKRMLMEKDLRESEKQYRFLFDEMMSGFALHDIICDEEGKPVNYRFLTVNSAFENLTGLKASDILGKTVLDVLPTTEAFWIERYGKVALEGTTDQFDGYNAAIGKHYEARAFCPEKGKFAVMFQDVTKRKETEKVLRENEERFSTLMQQSPNVIEIYALDGLQIEVNRAYEELWDFPASTTVNKFNLLKSQEVVDTGLIEYVKKAYAGEAVTVPEYEFNPWGETEAGGVGRVRWLSTKVYPLINEEGKVRNIVITHDDISERKEAEAALLVAKEKAEESEMKFRKLIEQSPLPMTVTDANQDIEFFNDKFTELFGYTTKDVSTAEKWWELAYPDEEYREQVQNAWVRAVEKSIAEDTSIEMQEWDLTIKDKSVRRVEFRMVPMNEISLIVMHDITERVQNEERLKDLLVEKDILLAEVHHRVKNNMQVIISLLGLQAREISDEQFLKAFEESRSRIESMAMVHEQLYRSSQYAHIEFRKYVDELASRLFNMYQIDFEQVQLEIEAEGIYLDLEEAIPCGLILNELITNSLKYAFSNGRKGNLWVKLESEGSNMMLTVGDDGVGTPDNFDLETTQSLGLQLVSLLTIHDLQGSIELESQKGMQFNIIFPM